MDGPTAAVTNSLGEHQADRLGGEALTLVGRRQDVPARLVDGLAVALDRPVTDAADPFAVTADGVHHQPAHDVLDVAPMPAQQLLLGLPDHPDTASSTGC